MLKDVARMFGIGACLGWVVTLAVARVYHAFLYGTARFEPLLLSAALSIVLLFALGGAFVPAWRAARLQPERSCASTLET
jgi:ABC-type antimicrobial peptide transport system permease subunit